LEASRLAIKHTEFYFNEIRRLIGDDEFANFLQLKPKKEELERTRDRGAVICASSSHLPFYYSIALLVLFNCWLINYST
jgi:hypothetical protein